jgi:hypothetical protein
MTEAEWEAGGDPAALLSFLGDRAGPRRRRLFACACARRIRHLLQFPESFHAIEAAERHADGLLEESDLLRYEQAARRASAQAVREAHSVWALGPTAPSARAAWVGVWAACAAENTCDRFPPVGTEAGTVEAGFQGCLALRTAQVASWARSVADELSGTPSDDETPGETALFFSFLRGLKNTVQRIEQAVRDGLETCESVCQAHLVREIFGNPFRPIPFDPVWRTVNDGVVLRMATAIYQDRSWDDLPILADALEEAGCDQPRLLEHLHGPGPHTRGCWALDLILGRA